MASKNSLSSSSSLASPFPGPAEPKQTKSRVSIGEDFLKPEVMLSVISTKSTCDDMDLGQLWYVCLKK